MAATGKPRTPAFTDRQIELGLYLLIARAYSTRLPECEPVADPATDEALAGIVDKQRLDRGRMDQVGGAVHAVEQAIREGVCPSVSAGRIDQARKSLLSEWGVDSTKGALIWPPASRTIAVRLGEGNWADALKNLSIPVSSLGRQRGSGRFAPDEMRRVFTEFKALMESRGLVPTLGAYAEWANEARMSGRIDVPSVATIRQRYGKWAKVLEEMEALSNIN